MDNSVNIQCVYPKHDSYLGCMSFLIPQMSHTVNWKLNPFLLDKSLKQMPFCLPTTNVKARREMKEN